MTGLRTVLRFWLRRLLWLIAAAVVAVLVAYLPAGFVDLSPEPLTPPPSAPVERDLTEPFLIEPWELRTTAARPWTWSPAEYAAAVREYMVNLAAGQVEYALPLGYSSGLTNPLLPEIERAWTRSLRLFLSALLIGLGAGILLGGLAAWVRAARGPLVGFSVASLSIPDFFLVLFGQILAVWAFETFGVRLWTVGVPGGVRHWLLPTVALSLAPVGYTLRLSLGSLDEVLSQDYIRTARAKGLSEWLVLYKHAVRNVLPRVLNGLPAILNATLSSLVVVEMLTSWPGLGMLLHPGLLAQPVVVATVGLVFALWYGVVDTLAHTLRMLANPLLREGEA